MIWLKVKSNSKVSIKKLCKRIDAKIVDRRRRLVLLK